MRENDHTFFANRQCKYYPCHERAGEEFNCLFCYCPLYALGEKCGGNFRYTEKGIKDCSNCLIPHNPGGYDRVLAKFREVSELAKRKEG